MKDLSKVSYEKANSVLKKFRYKPRREWSEDDRTIFRLCNFAVLSRKRLSSLLLSIQRQKFFNKESGTPVKNSTSFLIKWSTKSLGDIITNSPPE